MSTSTATTLPDGFESGTAGLPRTYGRRWVPSAPSGLMRGGPRVGLGSVKQAWRGRVVGTACPVRRRGASLVRRAETDFSAQHRASKRNRADRFDPGGIVVAWGWYSAAFMRPRQGRMDGPLRLPGGDAALAPVYHMAGLQPASLGISRLSSCMFGDLPPGGIKQAFSRQTPRRCVCCFGASLRPATVGTLGLCECSNLRWRRRMGDPNPVRVRPAVPDEGSEAGRTTPVSVR